MQQLLFLLLALTSVMLTYGDPINDATDVGKVIEVNGQKVVSGQQHYPYLVHIKLMQINKGYNKAFYCTGVIIGKTTVLTAAHCFRGLKKLIGQVHAGIVDVELEKENGQRLVMKDHLVHKGYRYICQNDKDQWCNAIHDVAIIWLHEEFLFGPNVRLAKLNVDTKRPVGKMGWILGWGENNKDSSMLQRGLMKVLSHEDCENFNSHRFVPHTFICLRSQTGLNTRSESGDSGGPFVISGTVYGVCSQNIFSVNFGKTLDIYTDVAKYDDWIRKNLHRGPPIERVRTYSDDDY